MQSHQLRSVVKWAQPCGQLVDKVDALQLDESSPHAAGILLPEIQIVNNSQVFPLPLKPAGP